MSVLKEITSQFLSSFRRSSLFVKKRESCGSWWFRFTVSAHVTSRQVIAKRWNLLSVWGSSNFGGVFPLRVLDQNSWKFSLHRTVNWLFLSHTHAHRHTPFSFQISPLTAPPVTPCVGWRRPPAGSELLSATGARTVTLRSALFFFFFSPEEKVI